jgi:hypothetical protein
VNTPTTVEDGFVAIVTLLWVQLLHPCRDVGTTT